MRGTRDDCDTVGDIRTRHRERRLKICSAIIDTRQDMAVKINHHAAVFEILRQIVSTHAATTLAVLCAPTVGTFKV